MMNPDQKNDLPRIGRPPMPENAGKRSHLHLRIERQRKAAYVKAAQRKKGRTLADWCLKHLDKASGYSEDGPKT